MRRLSFFLLVVLLLGHTGQSQADLILQPAGLNPGDQYRLVFTTSTTLNATSTDINVYNNHVNSAANAPGALTSGWGLTWSALASTQTADAISNTGTYKGTLGIPIYLVEGTKVADSYADFWDLSLEAPMNRTELDTLPPGGSLARVWTGTSGTGSTNGNIALGTDTPFYGRWTGTFNDAFGLGERSFTSSYALYGISNVLTATSAVPEPNAFFCLSLAGISFALGRRRDSIDTAGCR